MEVNCFFKKNKWTNWQVPLQDVYAVLHCNKFDVKDVQSHKVGTDKKRDDIVKNNTARMSKLDRLTTGIRNMFYGTGVTVNMDN